VRNVRAVPHRRPGVGAARAGQTGRRLAFIRVELDIGIGRMVAGEWGVCATPMTVMYFSQGKKVRAGDLSAIDWLALTR